MKYRVFTKIGLRLIAVYFFMTYLFYGVSAISYLLTLRVRPNESVDMGALFATMPMVFMFVISILLWIFAGKIASCFVGKSDDAVVSQEVDYERIQSIGFCIVGVLVMANAIPDLFGCIYQFTQLGYGDRLYGTSIEKLITSGLKTVVGIWLVLGAQGIVNVLKKVRAVGNNEGPEE